MNGHSERATLMADNGVNSAKCPLCNAEGRFAYAGRDLLFDRPETYDYYQCTGCDAVFQYPPAAVDVIAGFYPDAYRVYEREDKVKEPSNLKKGVLRTKYGYHHLRVPAIYRLLAPIASVLTYKDGIPYKPNGRALDVGCANGRFMRALRALGWSCEGVDFNINAVNTCRAQGLKVHHGDLESAHYDDASFDLITARHVIEHLPDPSSFVGEAGRILRPGGQLLIATPNSQALGRQWFRQYWFANDVPRHLILFSPSNLDALVVRHSLKRVTLRLNTSPKGILNSIDYKTGNRKKPSHKKKSWRLLAKPYVLFAGILSRGDEIFAIYEKA